MSQTPKQLLERFGPDAIYEILRNSDLQTINTLCKTSPIFQQICQRSNFQQLIKDNLLQQDLRAIRILCQRPFYHSICSDSEFQKQLKEKKEDRAIDNLISYILDNATSSTDLYLNGMAHGFSIIASTVPGGPTAFHQPGGFSDFTKIPGITYDMSTINPGKIYTLLELLEKLYNLFKSGDIGLVTFVLVGVSPDQFKQKYPNILEKPGVTFKHQPTAFIIGPLLSVSIRVEQYINSYDE